MKSAQKLCVIRERVGAWERLLLRTFGRQAILAKRAPLLLWATITDFDSPLPRLPPFHWLSRVPLVVSPSPSHHHRRRAVGSWPAERRIWLLPCSALHPFLATIIGELTLCRAGPIFWEHLMSAQRTAGLHNALLQVSALLIARFLELVSAPSRGARWAHVQQQAKTMHVGVPWYRGAREAP